MIDLHCHLLPGIDGGAQDLREALLLAQAAFADGITHCVATPHIVPGRYANTLSSITREFEEFRAVLDAENIPLKLGVAAEVRLSDNILDMVLSDQVPYLGDWFGFKVLLLDLPSSHIPHGTDKLVRWLRKNKIRPMFAHPERNKDVIRDFSNILPFAREGCLFQISAGSVVGQFGELVQRCSYKFLEQDLVTVLASEGLHNGRRAPALSDARKAVERIVGVDKSWNLVLGNPGKIAARHFSRNGNTMPCTLLPHA